MILVLNLKMNLSKNNIIEYEKMIHEKKVIVLPQYPYLVFFRKGNYELGSQDVSKFEKGSYTGEVCAKALKGLGVKYTLVGHSERKQHFHETTEDFSKKMSNLEKNGITPIYCISEEKKSGDDNCFSEIEKQLEAIPQNLKYVIIAYEPTWMIGRSETNINKEHIEIVLTKIKEYMIERNINHSIIYGGGVNERNILELNQIPANEGYIISSSALNGEILEKIYDSIK